MTDFAGLLHEVLRGDSRVLSDTREGAYQSRRIIVQRSDGAIFEAWDLFSDGRDVAQPWSLVQLEYVYAHAAWLFPEPSELDSEALGHVINCLQAVDEAVKVLGARAS